VISSASTDVSTYQKNRTYYPAYLPILFGVTAAVQSLLCLAYPCSPCRLTIFNLKPNTVKLGELCLRETLKEVRMSWGGMGEHCYWSLPRGKHTQ
jgi:hypothetical protein